MRKHITFILLTFVLVSVLSAAGLQAPTGMMCELLRNPARAVITDDKPEFGWIVNDDRQGAEQSAFQIIVASSLEIIDKNKGDMWDSKTVESNRSINVEYEGKTLQPMSQYWWKVRTWDGNNKESEYSEAQMFRTGKFEAERSWPGESKWVNTEDGEWLLENRQRSEYIDKEPVELIQHSTKHFFADFGKAAFATLKLKMTAPPHADSVTVFLGERKTYGNLVHKKPGRSNIGFKRIAIALMEGTHEYMIELPRHRSHYPNSQVLADHMPEVAPYRYAEIVNSPSIITVENIRQVALYYYFDDDASYFSCSNDNLNQVWELCKYTLKATPFLALYADGNRERMPYEADAYIQQLGHYSVDREYSVGRYTNQFLLFNPSWPTEWHLHAVIMAWADYLYTGNTESIQAYYDEFAKKTHSALAGENGLISTKTGLVTKEYLADVHFHGNNFRDIVDWPQGTPKGKKQASNASPRTEGETDGYVFTTYNTVVNALHYKTLVIMSEFAAVLEKYEDADLYQQRAEQVKESFNLVFLDKNSGHYVDGDETDHASLHANMFPLAVGLVPEEYVDSVAKFIQSRGLASGVYGAQYLLDALYNAGYDQYALELMTSEAKRSWMNMIRVGSTMTTEAWDEFYKPNLTWNHAWGSAPANIIPRKMFGIEPAKPGWKKAIIKPQMADLKNAEIKVPTIRGSIEAKWEKNDSQVEFWIKIPANMSAEVWLPAGETALITESGKELENTAFIKIVSKTYENTVCQLEPGLYKFAF